MSTSTATQKSNLNPSITFFYTDNCERQAIAPIADEAEKRGFNVLWSMNSQQRAEIGVYCEHACKPNADFSIILLHDLAQRHDIWPQFWHYEPWQAFDMGILPGQAWVERWQTQAGFSYARPKLGVFELGWPKADLVFRNKAHFKQEAETLRAQLGLKHAQSVLYAPSWENHGKQDDFVQALKHLPVNLLLKQAPWSPSYTQVWDNIHAMNALHQGCADNVYIIDPEISIMYCLGLADVMVSDESSVLTEALLLDVPGVAVTDWLIPDQDPPRPASVPYDYVTKTTKVDLTTAVQAILDNKQQYQADVQTQRAHQFSCLGESAVAIMDNLEAALQGLALPHAPVSAQVDKDYEVYQLAESLIARGQQVEAMRILIPLVQAKTQCWHVYNDLGGIVFAEGNLEDAVFLFEQAIQRAQNPSIALSNLIEVYCAKQEPSNALAMMAKLTRHLPQSQQAIPAIRQCMEQLMHPGF